MTNKLLSHLLILATAMSSVAYAAEETSVKPATTEEQQKLLSIGEPTLDNAGQQLNARIIANYTGRKYRLGPNDVLAISVYDAPEFSDKDLLVHPDGSINIAPLESINVAGLTIDELQKEVTERLKFYLNEPHVTIKLTHTKPFQVYVTGAVLKPGAYEMVTDMFRNQSISNYAPGVLLERKLPLLSNILVASGGLRYDADLEHVRIHNKFDGSSFEVNVLDLIQNGNTDQDMFLIAGDSVEVPALATPYAVDEEKYKAMLGSSVFQNEIPVKVYGYVNKPGLIMLDSAQSANLNSAIGAAGGYLATEASYSPNKVYISRVDGKGHLTTTTVDPRHEDLTLRPNDIVYVPNKLAPRIGKAFDYTARVIAPFAAAAGAANGWALLLDPTRFNVNVSPRRF